VGPCLRAGEAERKARQGFRHSVQYCNVRAGKLTEAPTSLSFHLSLSLIRTTIISSPIWNRRGGRDGLPILPSLPRIGGFERHEAVTERFLDDQGERVHRKPGGEGARKPTVHSIFSPPP